MTASSAGASGVPPAPGAVPPPLPSLAFDGVSAHVCVLDAAGTIVAVNDAWRAFARENAGDPARTAEGMNYLAVIDAADGAGAEGAREFGAGLRAVLAGERAEWSTEYPCHAPHEHRWFRARATRVAAPGPLLAVVAHENVTAAHDLADLRRETAARYDSLVDAMADGVFIAQDYRFAFGSAGLAALLGYTQAEFAGLPFEAVVDPAFLPLWTERFELRTRAEVHEPSRRYDVRLLRRDGRPIWVELRASRIARDGRLAVLGVVHDITERRRRDAETRALEDRLHDAQKLEAMGRLAGAVAHDFNNLLTIIRSTVDLLRRQAGAAPFDADLADVAVAVERAAALTTPLLAFGRRQHADIRRLPVHPLVAGIVDGERASLPAGIALDTRCACVRASEAGIEADARQFEEVVRHLLRNAVEAMPAGGRIVVGCRREEVPDERLHRHGILPAGDYVVVEVTDQGVGMGDDVLERLFEPFFTTKPQGQGPGLGLAMAYGVVRRGGGSIVVHSSPGSGSTVEIWWPAAAHAEAETVAGPPAVVASVPRGAQADTLLVVDDEEGVRRVLARALAREGHRVVVAEGGAEGLARAETEGDRLRAIVTDVRMPGMSGVEMVAELLARGIDLPVLFVSGQLDAPLPNRWPTSVPRRFLRKPFTLDELTAELEALGVSPPARR